jgi:hypothetical protein
MSHVTRQNLKVLGDDSGRISVQVESFAAAGPTISQTGADLADAVQNKAQF